MQIPLLDLRRQYQHIRDEILAAIAGVMEEQVFRGGTVLAGFERALADYVGCTEAVGVGSGTDALWLTLDALGVKEGDEIITTPFSFYATAASVVRLRATPVFVDIDPRTGNLNPEHVARAVTRRTRGIIPVHLFGLPADMDTILHVAQEHGLFVLEDAAQALGAKYKGRNVGTLGNAAAISFYPTKNLGAAGEGGAVLTSDAGIAERVRLLRCHGMTAPYRHEYLGTNSHLHTLQAAVLRVKLRYLDAWNETRRTIAQRYTAHFRDVHGVTPPWEPPEAYHVYHQYVIRSPHRDALADYLREQGIGCAVYYPRGLHEQPALRAHCRIAVELRETERACREVLALPIFPELRMDEVDYVADRIKTFLLRVA